MAMVIRVTNNHHPPGPSWSVQGVSHWVRPSWSASRWATLVNVSPRRLFATQNDRNMCIYIYYYIFILYILYIYYILYYIYIYITYIYIILYYIILYYIIYIYIILYIIYIYNPSKIVAKYRVSFCKILCVYIYSVMCSYFMYE